MKTLKLFLCLFLAALAPHLASALIVGPYTPDANTLHLWHFNGSSTITTDEVQTASITLTNVPQSVTPGSTISLGNPAFNGTFGTSLHITATNFNAGNTYAYASNLVGQSVNTVPFRNATNGAFTFEAMVKLDGAPTNNNGNYEIICGDGGATRSWQFRITSSGAGTYGPARLEFNSITTSSGTMGQFFANIPTNGANAWATGQWYHVALTYTGTNGATPGVLSFYWTLVDPAISAANLVTSYSGLTGVIGGTPNLAVGGNSRINNGIANNEGFKGYIDEVRISGIARTAGQMLFASSLVTISQQPYVQEGVDFGGPGSMSVAASSLLPLSYQWRQNGTPISGATNTTYAFTNATLANAGNYDCVITNSNPSSATSAVCVVSIGAANFLAHRYGFTNDVTDSFGTANGTLFGGASVSGGALLLDGGSGSYLQLPGGLVTNQAAITIEAWASFTTIANNTMFFAFGDTNGANGRYYIFMTPHGTTARIAITAADPGFNAEQIANSGVNLDNRTGVQIVSVFAPYAGYEALYTNGVLAVINTNITTQLSSVVDNYSFIGRSLYSPDPYLLGSVDEFRIYNGAMSASTIQQSYLQGPDNGLSTGPVAILVSPTNTTVAANQVVTFSGLASGLPAISYQWFKNGTLIPGATNQTYSYNAPFSDNNATFVLKATNTVSATTYTATSSSATLTVLVPETIAWLGANDNLWNLSSLNWSNAAQQVVAYVQFDGAVFDDRGVGQPNVDLQFTPAPVSLLVSNNATDYLFYSSGANGSLSALGTFTKQGTGKLTIDVTNNSTGLTYVRNGTLQIGNGDALGSLGSGPVTNNATVQFNRADGLGVPNDLHGTGTFVVNSGSVTPSSTNNDYTGSTVINGGIWFAVVSNAFGAVSGGTTVNNGGQVYITANVNIGAEALALNGTGDGNGALRKGGAGVTTNSGPVTLGSDSTIGVDGGATLTLNNPLGITGAFTLTKNGGGTLALNATNHYAATTLTAGVINVNTNGALGTGPVTATTSGRFVIADGLNVTNDFTANAVNPGAATGFIMVNDNTNGTVTTVSGPLALNANPASGGHFIGTFSSGYLNVAGPVTMPGGTFMVIRDGRVRFANTSSSYPEIQVRANTTSIGLNNGVATNALMDLAGNGTAFFDLNGFNQTLAGLKNTVTPANAGIGFVTNSSATTKTLTLDLGTGNTYSTGSGLVGNLSLALQSGTQIFTGNNNTYTGNTTVNGGTLELSLPSFAASSTVTVANGAVLQLDYSTTNQVTGLVLNGVSQPLGVYSAATSSPYISGSGFLQVAVSVATNPTNITAVVNGNKLELTWPADHLGWTLQSQTNNLTKGLGTNWVDVPGSTSVRSVTNTINPANGSVFYRMKY